MVWVDGGAGMVLTNRHVVSAGDGTATITFANGREVEGTVLASDKTGADLATIAIPADDGTPFIGLAPRYPAQGEPICQVGWGGMQTMQKRTGVILGYREADRYHMMLSFRVIPGDSGSGVFLLREKQLVGIVWGWNNWGSGPMEPLAVTLVNAHRFVEACKPLLPILPWRRQIEGQLPKLRQKPGGPPIIVVPPKAQDVKPPDPKPVMPVVPAEPIIPAGLDYAALEKKINDQFDALRALVQKIPAGKDGKDGRDGAPGKDGRPGKDGLAGPAGLSGLQGIAGPQGVPGTPANVQVIQALQTQIDTLRADFENLNGAIFKIKITPKAPN